MTDICQRCISTKIKCFSSLYISHRIRSSSRQKLVIITNFSPILLPFPATFLFYRNNSNYLSSFVEQSWISSEIFRFHLPTSHWFHLCIYQNKLCRILLKSVSPSCFQSICCAKCHSPIPYPSVPVSILYIYSHIPHKKRPTETCEALSIYILSNVHST